MFRFSGFTERANEALNLGVETASNLGHNYIGIEDRLVQMVGK